MTHTLGEIADQLGVSTRTVQEWVSRGELRAVNVSRNRSSRKPRLRITQADRDAFLAGRAVGADPPMRKRRFQKPLKQYV